MIKLITITVLFVCSFGSFAQVDFDEIQFIHTNVKLKANNNTLLITILKNGTVTLSYPDFHILSGTNVKFNSKQSVDSLFDTLATKNIKWNSAELKSTLIAAKSQSQELFYSSERDLITLNLYKHGHLLDKIEFDNLQELNHFYKHLGRWKGLIDVVNNIESIATIKNINKYMEISK